MTRYLIFFGLLGCLSCTHAQSDKDFSALESAFEFFAGSCWEGTFSDGKSTDVQCFRTVDDGQFIRSNHHVEGARGPYGGETIFRWNSEKKIIEYTYWDTSGGISRGTMKPDEAGLKAPDEVYEAPEGGNMVISTRWNILGPKKWEQVVESVSGDTQKTLWKITYAKAPLSQYPEPNLRK